MKLTCYWLAIQIGSLTWKNRYAVTDVILLAICTMKNGIPGSICYFWNILIISQLARLENQTSLIIISKQNKCCTKVFSKFLSFEQRMKRLPVPDSKYCFMPRGETLYSPYLFKIIFKTLPFLKTLCRKACQI